MGQPRPDRADRPQTAAATTSPPIASPSHPPPLVAIKGAHPHPPLWSDLFLLRHLRRPCAALLAIAKSSRTALSSPSPTTLTTLRAPRRRVRPSRTVSCRLPPPDATPTAVPLQSTTPHRARSSGELLPPCRPKTGPPPYRLAPWTLPAAPHHRHRQNSAGPPSTGAMGVSSPASRSWAKRPSGPGAPGRAGLTGVVGRAHCYSGIFLFTF
jgi:hypothetical protein